MRKTARDAFLFGASTVLDRLVGLLILPLLVRTLPNAEYGAWTQVFSAYTFISAFITLGFYYTASNLVAGRSDDEATSIFQGITRIIFWNACLALGIGLLFPSVLSNLIFADESHSPLIPFAMLYVVSECFFEMVVLAYLRSRSRVGLCALYHGMRAALRFPAIALGLSISVDLRSPLAFLSVLNIAAVLSVLMFHLNSKPATRNAEAPGFWRDAILQSATSAITVLLIWANGSMNRFFLTHFASLEEVALYAANFSVLSAITVVQMVLGFGLLHRASKGVKTDSGRDAQEALVESSVLYIYLVLPLVLLCALFYRPLIHVLAKDEFLLSPIGRCLFIVYFFVFGLEQITTLALMPNAPTKALAIRAVGFVSNILICALILSQLPFAALAIVPPLLSSIFVFTCSLAALKTVISFEFPYRQLRPLVLPTIAVLVTGVLLQMFVQATTIGGLAWQIPLLLLLYGFVESLHPESFTRRIIQPASAPV